MSLQVLFCASFNRKAEIHPIAGTLKEQVMMKKTQY
jgi:hypothetical protein